MTNLIGADSAEYKGKMHRDLDDFIAKFTKGYIAVKPESVDYVSTDDSTTFPNRLGLYVAEYIRRSELLRQVTDSYNASPSQSKRTLLMDVQIQLHKHASELNAMIQTGRANNWLDEGLQAKLDTAMKEKIALENRIDELTEQLKECQDNYARYMDFVKRPKGSEKDDVEYGDVLGSN